MKAISIEIAFLTNLLLFTMLRLLCVLSFLCFFGLSLIQAQNFECLSEGSTSDAMQQAFGDLWAKKSPAIMLGIAEGVGINQELYLSLIKLCNRNLGIRHIACERSHGEAFLFNKYLETGNENYLGYEYEWSEEMRIAFRDLYEFNRTLPEGKKLVFLGIDAVQYLSPIVLTLQELVPNTRPPKEIESFVDSIKSLTLPLPRNPTLSNQQLLKEKERQLAFLRAEITTKMPYYRTFFGENYKHIAMIISNTSTFLEPGKRNTEMYKGAMMACKIFDIKDGIIGMFGSNHTGLDKKWSFASKLKNEEASLFANNTYVVNVHYERTKSFYGKIVTIENSELDRVYGKRSDTEEAELKQNTKCDNFILKVSSDRQSLVSRMDYLVYITGASPIKVLRPFN
ncbi:MAG TPA: hypothetical protein VGD65_07660 [Chryseosolibacter sp.]